MHLFLWESPKPKEYITSQQIGSLEEGSGTYVAMAHWKKILSMKYVNHGIKMIGQQSHMTISGISWGYYYWSMLNTYRKELDINYIKCQSFFSQSCTCRVL